MKYNIEIVPDESPENPRTSCDNLGTFFGDHRNYIIGDENVYDPRDMSRDELNELIILPVYMLEHGGVKYSTGSFTCAWDSCQVGAIYITKAKVREEYGYKNITAKRRGQIEEYLQGEVETFSAWANGEVVGYQITDKKGKHKDSCYGYYSHEDAQSEADNMVAWYKSEDKLRKAEKRKAKMERKDKARYYIQQLEGINLTDPAFFPAIKLRGPGDVVYTNWMDLNSDCLYALKKFIKRYEKIKAQNPDL